MSIALTDVRTLIDSFSLSNRKELFEIISKMTLADLNRALYRCDKEERDEGYGFDTYNIPNFGFIIYAGLQGIGCSKITHKYHNNPVLQSSEIHWNLL